MRWLAVAIVIALGATADAHVGSPDVFFAGDAGPYHLFVTVRLPQVIPGVAAIEIRSESADVREISVVPMRLTGAGSEHPPAPDRADRSPADPSFFTANLWLMEGGSMQVRLAVDGARGPATLAVPVAAYAQRTLAMTPGLGAVLFGLMLLLALAIVAIVIGAMREATLAAGVTASRSLRPAMIVVSVVVAGAIALGNAWWNATAREHAHMVMKPWHVDAQVNGCQLTLPPMKADLLPDHGHDMHLFLVRMPALDQLAHLHPQRDDSGGFVQTLPSLPAGRYQLFADVVLDSGFPITGTAEIDLPASSCAPLAGDDSAWSGTAVRESAPLAGGAQMIWDRPAQLRAGVAASLAFRVVSRDGSPAPLEPYMGMAAHAAIVRTDATVFAHLHPNGSVAMPALELVQGSGSMSMPMTPVSSSLAFPFGFPRAGDYRIFVQVKRDGAVETAAFDAHVE